MSLKVSRESALLSPFGLSELLHFLKIGVLGWYCRRPKFGTNLNRTPPFVAYLLLVLTHVCFSSQLTGVSRRPCQK